MLIWSSDLKNLDVEVELGFSAEKIATEVQRCLNCDVHTVFDAPLCTECDACIDICPVECLSITQSSKEILYAVKFKPLT